MHISQFVCLVWFRIKKVLPIKYNIKGRDWNACRTTLNIFYPVARRNCIKSILYWAISDKNRSPLIAGIGILEFSLFPPPYFDANSGILNKEIKYSRFLPYHRIKGFNAGFSSKYLKKLYRVWSVSGTALFILHLSFL